MENFSIITDFGCPFNCGFCITKSQKTKKSFQYYSDTFDRITEEFRKGSYTRISISGGGEPLFTHSNDIKQFYKDLFEFSRGESIPVHVHTNMSVPPVVAYAFDKVTISVNLQDYEEKFKNWSDIRETRFVYVSDGTDLDVVKQMVAGLSAHAQFTVKQMDGFPREIYEEIESFMSAVPRARFLPEGDYNRYYVLNEHQTYDRFKDISFK